MCMFRWEYVTLHYITSKHGKGEKGKLQEEEMEGREKKKKKKNFHATSSQSVRWWEYFHDGQTISW